MAKPLTSRLKSLARLVVRPSPAIATPQGRSAAVLLQAVLVFYVGWMAFWVVYHAWRILHDPTLPVSTLAAVAFSLVLLLGAYAFSRSRHYRLGGWVLVATSATAILSSALFTTPEIAVCILFYASFPVILAALVLTARAALAAFLAVALGAAAVLARRPDLPHALVVAFLGYFVFVGVVLILATWLKERVDRHYAENERRAGLLLVNSAKLASLGFASAGIAHEINNPLQVIQMHAQRLERLAATGGPPPADLAEAAAKIHDMALRIGTIVKSLRGLSRDTSGDPFVQSAVAPIVATTLDLCRRAFERHQVALEAGPVPPGLTLTCRPVEVSQILLNLLNNALDAATGAPEKWVRLGVEADDVTVRFTVSDSGPGVPKDLAPHVMEPFVTTKQATGGTGLGLSLSLELARAHGGTLYLAEGAPPTRFVLELPRNLPVSIGRQRG